MVLAADMRRVVCVGDDAELEQLLREIGFEVARERDPDPAAAESPAEAVVLSVDGKPTTDAAAAAAARVGPGGIVAIPVAGGERTAPRPVWRPVRAAQLAVSPAVAVSTERLARRLGNALRKRDLDVALLRTGDRTRVRYGIGSGGWLRRGRLPVGAIITGSRGERRPSIAEAATDRAAATLGRRLERRSADVFETGKLGIELVDRDGDAYFLSIAAGRAREALDRSRAAIAAVLAADPPEAIAARLMAPLDEGSLGPARYVLEPLAAGRHPIWLSRRGWSDCLEFLGSFFELAARAPGVDLPASAPDVDTAAKLIARHAPGGKAAVVERVAAEIGERTGGLPRGWVHGDFWPRNLVVRGGRLCAVLDWEWAGCDGLPLLDLIDLTCQLGWRGSRGLTPGRALVEVLWPLAKRGGDERIRGFAERLGITIDRRTLEALVIAYWLLRTARSAIIRAARLDDPRWVRENIAGPLAHVEGALQPIRPPAAARRPARAGAAARGDGASAARRRPTEPDLVVLGYHAVSDRWPAPLSVAPAQLEAHLKLLAARGYHGATFSEAVLGGPPLARTVVVTFDDGYRSVLENARPVLDRLGFPATVFVPTAFVGRRAPMSWPGIDEWLDGPHERELTPLSWPELSTLAEAGWEIGSHTRTHPRLTALASEALAAELATSRSDVEARLGIRCRALAYPYGDHDERVIAAAAAAGYETGCTYQVNIQRPMPLRWPRVGVHRRDHLMRFRVKVSPAIRLLRRIEA